MGFRTVIVLQNDEASNWHHDPHLGDHIMAAGIEYLNQNQSGGRIPGVGFVAEVTHNDFDSLLYVRSGRVERLAAPHCSPSKTVQQGQLEALAHAAKQLGFKLVPDTAQAT